MWQIENHTPFGAQSAFARDRNGAETWLVAVKATYRIQPDGSLGIEDPVVPQLAPAYFGEPGRSSLKYESDLQLTKPGTDIILHGHAYAPGKPVTQMGVLLKAGPIKKALLVTGNRYYERGPLGIKLSDPIPFAKIPLTYEHTFGGRDDSKQDSGFSYCFPGNPVGTGYALRKSHLIGQRAPSIAYARNGSGVPAGFGPLPGHWSPRNSYSGTYDEKWQQEKAPFMPDDFDNRYFYCAPEDQQVPGFLKGGESVEIIGMSPHGPLKFRLPAPDLTFKTFLGRTTKTHKASLHTVILEPDIPGFSMVWHTSLYCHNQDHMLEKTIIT